MKKYHFIAALFCIALSSCGKKAETVFVVVPNASQVPANGTAVPGFVAPPPGVLTGAERDITISHLKQAALAIIQFTDKNNDLFPDLSSIEAVGRDVASFLNTDPVGGEEIFADGWGKPFKTNISVSKMNLDKIPDTRNTVLLYQDSADGDSRAVVFCDGHVK